MLPPWVVFPLAGLTLLVTAAHVVALQSADLSVRRRRIRSAAGVIMMLVTGLLAYALGVQDALPSPAADPDSTRTFLLVWSSIVALLFMVILLAAADLIHTGAVAASARAKLAREMRDRLVDDLRQQRGAGRTDAEREPPAAR